MGRPFSQDVIEAIRNSGDIVRVISDYVPLKPGGSRLKGLCPFHQEKTPSFSVDPNTQLFYCFGCQTGGDIFKFVMLYEKVGFAEAVEMLAKRFGVSLPSSPKSNDGTAERLARLNEAAASFFRARLKAEGAGGRCRSYLERRGITADTEERLGLGYAPDAWDSLRGHLLAKRFEPRDLLLGGLVQSRKSGQGEYDRFRDRLIFPIRDIQGRTIAFGGRTLGDSEPKYINSPETPAYTKGRHLYGLDLAKQAVRREGFAIVVEGYLDLAAVLQAGLDNVVASLGTAFTAAQARLLARSAERVVVSYDGDAAGAEAATRSLDLLLERGFEVRVAELPAGLDPDDFIRRNGAEAYGQLVRAAPDYLQFLIRRQARQRDLDRIEEKIAGVNAVLPHLAKLGNSIERASWATRLADAMGLEDELVLQELRVAVRSSRTRIRHRAESVPPPREAEARLVMLLLRSEQERARWADELDPEDLARTRVGGIVGTILDLTRGGRQVTHPEVLSALEDEDARDLLTRIAFRDDPEEGPTVEDCLWAFRKENIRRREKEVLKQIDRLQKSENPPAEAADLDQRLMRLQHLARERDALH